MVNKTKWMVILALVAAGAWLFYQKVYIPKATYGYVTPEKGDLKLTVFGIGTVSAKNFYPVSSNFGGKLLNVKKDQGEWVKKGEIVAEIDPVDLGQQKAQARALVEKVGLEKIASEKELESLKAQRELAHLTFVRYERLYRKGYAAQAEYDKARTDLHSLEAAIEAAKARIASAGAVKRRALKNLEAIEERIGRLTVLSPVDGYVVSKEARAGQTIAPQQPVVTVVKADEIWVKANIDERISGDIKTGQKAAIILRSKEGAPLDGEVVRIEAESDPVTEERIVDVAFDELPKPFFINEQAEVRIVTGKLSGVLTIPARVMVQGGVWLYENGEAFFKPLKVLGRSGERVAVEGIDAHSRILVPDPHKKPLFDGVDIRVK